MKERRQRFLRSRENSHKFSVMRRFASGEIVTEFSLFVAEQAPERMKKNVAKPGNLLSMM
jgi:hypothetical protein